jgi:hypothetical protein
VKLGDPEVTLEHNHFEPQIMDWVRKHSLELYNKMPSRREMALADAEVHQDESQKLRAAYRKRVTESKKQRRLIRSRHGGCVSAGNVHPPNTLLRKVPPTKFLSSWTVPQITDQFRLRNGARNTTCASLFGALSSAPDAGGLLTLRQTLRVTFKKDAALVALRHLIEFENEKGLEYESLAEHPGDDSDTSESDRHTDSDSSPDDEADRMEYEQERELEEKVHLTADPKVAYCFPEYCAYGRTSAGVMVACSGEGCRGNGWYHLHTCLPPWESSMAATGTRQKWWCCDCQLRRTYRKRRKQAR